MCGQIVFCRRARRYIVREVGADAASFASCSLSNFIIRYKYVLSNFIVRYKYVFNATSLTFTLLPLADTSVAKV